MSEHWLTAARQAALAAGGVIREFLGRPAEVRTKGAADLVTEVDTRCEELIRGVLLGCFPSHAVLGEEGGGPRSLVDHLWLVDPVDGTRNFVHGYPWVGVSIALQVRGRVEVGVVYDPVRDELFWAVRGEGAFLNGTRLSVSDTGELSDSLLLTGFNRFPQRQANLIAHLQGRCHGVRRSGSAALDLCAVAAGRADGFWEWGLEAWDMAAGSLLVAEAGGTVTGVAGEPLDLHSPGILCTNGRLHRQLLDLLVGG